MRELSGSSTFLSTVPFAEVQGTDVRVIFKVW
jgi:hypothetical protein